MANYSIPTQDHSKVSAYLIFFLAASFYLYEFILQVAPSVMAVPMMKTFQVSAEGFGVISAFYFYAYAPMQLLAGLLFDRYGPRKLMTAALFLCAIGSFFFASTDSVVTASIGRFLIGVGSAFSFIGVLVLVSRWFVPQHFAILAGIAQLMSSVGAMFGEVPLAALIEAMGWREASFILAEVGCLLALLLWWLIRDFPHQPTQSLPMRGFRDEWDRLLLVCKRSYTWITGAYAFCIWTPIAVFAALWGVPYLQEKLQVSLVVASGLCSMIWLGIGVGSPLLGWVSDRFYSRKLALTISSLCGLFATIILLYVPIPISWMYAVLFLLGFGAGGQTVSFAVVKDNNPSHLVGTASGFNNLSVLVGGAIFQPVVGVILHRSNEWQLDPSVPVHYAISSYQLALLVMPCCFLVSLILALWCVKESHPGALHTGLNTPGY